MLPADAKIAGTSARAVMTMRADDSHAHARRVAALASAEEGVGRGARRVARGAHRTRPAQGAAQPLQAPAVRGQERSQRRAPEGPVLQRGRGRRRAGPACRRRDRGRQDRRAGAPARQARPQAAGSGPAARGGAPRVARRRARVPARRRGIERDRRRGQRAVGHRAAAGARDPPRARQVRLPVLRRRPAPGCRSRRR